MHAVALPQAFQDGRLRVEGRQVGMDDPLRSGDCMRHFIHRHEPPVMAGDIEVGGQGRQAAMEWPGRMLAWVACGHSGLYAEQCMHCCMAIHAIRMLSLPPLLQAWPKPCPAMHAAGSVYHASCHHRMCSAARLPACPPTLPHAAGAGGDIRHRGCAQARLHARACSGAVQEEHSAGGAAGDEAGAAAAADHAPAGQASVGPAAAGALTCCS